MHFLQYCCKAGTSYWCYFLFSWKSDTQRIHLDGVIHFQKDWQGKSRELGGHKSLILHYPLSSTNIYYVTLQKYFLTEGCIKHQEAVHCELHCGMDGFLLATTIWFHWLSLSLCYPHGKHTATRAGFMILANSAASMKVVINLWVYGLPVHYF